MRKKIKIFILEDNEDDYILLKEILDSSNELNAKVTHSGRLESAIKLIKDDPVDMAIVDLNLPDSTGLDTFINFNDQFPFLPTVILTGSKDREIALAAVKKGAQDYLHKGEPSKTAIIRTIRYAIERQRLMNQLQDAMNEIKMLKGIIPICSKCKKIRDDKGYWNHLESYLEKYSDASFSHGMCPECSEELYGNEDWYIDMKKNE